ncbi:MAG: hypothetical protein WC520_02785 [Candidatus Paceibacterota bacterium]
MYKGSLEINELLEKIGRGEKFSQSMIPPLEEVAEMRRLPKRISNFLASLSFEEWGKIFKNTSGKMSEIALKNMAMKAPNLRSCLDIYSRDQVGGEAETIATKKMVEAIATTETNAGTLDPDKQYTIEVAKIILRFEKSKKRMLAYMDKDHFRESIRSVFAEDICELHLSASAHEGRPSADVVEELALYKIMEELKGVV